MWTWFHRLASPPHFYRAAGRLAPWFGWSATILIAFGLYGGLVWAPKDNEMGDGFRIIYVHVPSAWMSLCTYTTMAVAAAIGLIWRIKLAHAVAASTAVPGASFTFLALVTGSIWGKPMWGTWWVWDARLTSELVLLFLFLGYLALRAAFDDTDRADRASAVIINLDVEEVARGNASEIEGEQGVASDCATLNEWPAENVEAGALDFLEVREEVLAAAIRGDEAEALAFIEPLHDACFSHIDPFGESRQRVDIEETLANHRSS